MMHWEECRKLSLTMRKVGERRQIGSEETAAEKPDGFSGLRVRMLWKTSGPLKGTFVIIFDGNDYLDSTEKMEIRGNDDSRRLGVEEITGFRSVVGSVGYMANAFLPGLSVEASMLGRFRLCPTVKAARKANATINVTKEHRYVLTFQPGVHILLAFADSAGPNENGAQGGRLYYMSETNCEQISGFLPWESKKEKRVCRSIATGETLAYRPVLDSALWIQRLWLELTGKHIPVVLVTDSEGTAKSSVSTKLLRERRNRIDMALLRQSLRRGEYEMWWVPSRANLSDPFTKEIPSGPSPLSPSVFMKQPLLDALRSNNSNLKGAKRITRSKEDVSRY
jgi:hypothetical protein